MQLTFLAPYKSILPFNSIRLENFSILTGYNGSGKSHLLESIKNTNCQLDNILANEIALFDFKTFYLESEQPFNNQQIIAEKQQAWNRYNQNVNANPNIKAHCISFKSQLGQDNYKKILELGGGLPFLKIPQHKFNDQDLYARYSKYRYDLNAFFNRYNSRNEPSILCIKLLTQNLLTAIDEIDEDEFFEFYQPVALKNDFLPIQIGKLFIDYWYKYQMYEVTKIRELLKYDKDGLRKSFEEIHGPRPWTLIAQILKNFDSFQYSVNNPEGIPLDPYRVKNFQLLLTHNTKKIEIPFDNLSSGEKILFCLVLSIYKGLGDSFFPEVLLLDEIDASLHPSQIQNLLNVINEVFVKQNNVKVIMATHSPSTIALADEKSIYVVNNSGVNRIEKQSKKEALKILSEGFITLDEGLQIFDQLAKKELTVFTEGNNIDYINRAIQLFAPEYLTRIEINDHLKDKSGKNQLNMLYDLCLRMPHKNKILFIYDCDVTTKIEESENTFGFIFENNGNNSKVKRGVENLFDESFFTEDFYPLKSKDDGGVQSSLDKKKFAQFIIDRNNKNDFSNFKSMIEKISEILTPCSP